jgi:wyosine [tRNA(Phe)-imidazoG37] synthetase (radical SAM superfamily)
MVYATPDELKGLLKKRLEQLKAESARVDSFTFAGNGEPTLYPHFAEMVGVVREMRDKYYPEAVTTLLTNATQLKRKEIFDAVMKLDNPVLKLDAGTERLRQLINKNNEMGCTWEELLANLIAFGNKGIIQTLLFDGQSRGERVSNIMPEEFEPYIGHL